MKFINGYLGFVLFLAAVTFGTAIAAAKPKVVAPFHEVNLRADTTAAANQDPLLINAWGMASLGRGDEFWINDEGSGLSELVDGQGNLFASLPSVTIPAPGGAPGPSKPTGMVANTMQDFMLATGGPALFIFDTLDGTIAAWNSTYNSTAVIMVDNSGAAAYTGLAMATQGGTPFLYAANSHGSIDVFDDTFTPVQTAGGFVDADLPAGLTPYGVANIDGNIFVTYSQRSVATGAVDEFDSDGNLVRRFATGGTLNAPWGVVMAPKNFGSVSDDLLIGNFGDGTINAFAPKTGKFLGQVAGSNHQPLQISGLWTLMVGAGVDGVTHQNAIYFTAGPNSQKDGLFGFILPGPAPTPTPTPPPKKPKAKPTPTPYSFGY
jgi:uncharacterized protein (TIGR03118 family)